MLEQIPLGPFTFEYPQALIATLIGFALLIWLFWKYAYPPTVQFLSARSAQIQENYDRAEHAYLEALQVRDEYANRLASIEVEHRARLEAAVRDADAAQADIIADAQAAALAIRRRAEEEIARERTRQRILLRRQIVQITLDAAEQTVRELNSENAQHHLIQDFIVRVGKPEGNGRGAKSQPGNGRSAPDSMLAAGVPAGAPASTAPRKGGA